MNKNQTDQFKDMPKSYWLASSPRTDYPSLARNMIVDVAIIGGGLVGISTAYQLEKSGLQVAIFEGSRIAEGTSGHTTAKITSQHNLIYGRLIKDFGKKIAHLYATANETAIKTMKTIIEKDNIDCDYSPQPAYAFTQDAGSVERIKEEVEAAKSLGINASFTDKLPLAIPISGAVKFAGQGQFHPRKFLLALAEKITDRGNKIYEETRIVDLDKNSKGEYVLTTAKGNTIIAGIIVIASHYPFYNKLGAYYARLHQSRTYAVALKAKEKFPEGIYINTEQPNRSLRSIESASGEYILVVGDSHNTGQSSNTNKHYQALIDFAKTLFTVTDVPYRWSTQDCMTLDNIPYVGYFTDETPNIFIATGFGKWGITNGFASSIVLKDLILKSSSPWQAIYDPARQEKVLPNNDYNKQPLDKTESPLVDNIDKKYTETDVKINEGKVIEINGKKVGAYRDEDNQLHLVNITCTHMGCKVHWNEAERSWDCPCHGSRYDIDGNILDGPAVNPLSFAVNVNTVNKLSKEDF